MDVVALVLILLTVPFLLPIGLWVALYRTRTRLALLEEALEEQKRSVERLSGVVAQLRTDGAPRARPETAAAPVTPPVPVRPAAEPPPVAVPAAAAPAPRPPVISERPPIAAGSAVPASPPPATPITPSPATANLEGRPVQPVAPVPAPPSPAQPAPPASVPPAAARPPIAAPPLSSPSPAVPSGASARPLAGRPPLPPGERAPASPAAPGSAVPPPRPPSPPRAAEPPPPPPAPPAETPSFDWESLVGVKLFSAVAGIALVFAAIFFLRYSIQQGWLQPPVRVLIGIAVAIALLVVCEMKAARNYPSTANALDAAAIAILFATFFAAHALWNLIPAPMTFGLLAAVTALAVLLSIRRESLFIAVLGLLGGFATPALLSTGENRPIPLFAYLVLLNVGLAWVAYRQVWPVLTILTLVFTTVYQWVWVYKFLNANDLSLAMGIFAVFPVLSVGALLLGRRGRARAGAPERDAFERTTIVAAALPLVFVTYLATVRDYGAHPGLLFGFLLLIDVGLAAVSIALRRTSLHVVGALATLLVWAVWLTTSYSPGSRVLALAFVSAFVVLYLLAPAIAKWFGRPFDQDGDTAVLTAPALLFVFSVIARIDPGAASPWPLFAPLAILVLLCASAAYAYGKGIFFIASFLAVAAQAVWSARHLTVERLPAAVAVYALFGVISSAVPVVARRRGRTLEPESGTALVLLASLGLLLFLSRGGIAPAALWALALLLAILNAGMFIESASSRVPLLSQVGSVMSWLILGLWWRETAGVVGVLPSLAVLTGLTLITLAGHAWAYHSMRTASVADDVGESAGRGLYLGLIGHLFLFFVAINREWSLPPWPLFATLGIVTLAASLTSITVRAPMLHVAGVGAASVVLIAWTEAVSVMPWSLTGLLASAALSAYALAWIAMSDRTGAGQWGRIGAAAALIGSEFTVVAGSGIAGATPFPIVLAMHALNIVVLLALTLSSGWQRVAAGAMAVSWLAVLQWQFRPDLDAHWRELLVLAAVFYAIFTAYALVAGPRRREEREPWLVALAASVMAFFAAREAFERAGLEWMIGVVPVVEGLVTAVLLRALLKLEAAGQRDLTRLALVAGAALAFVTVAIPLQLEHQWITIGWALEGVALAWLYQRVPHRGLLIACGALFIAVFARLALNPEVWSYEPRGSLRILNWYLYTYAIAAVSMFVAAWFLSKTGDRIGELPRLSNVLPAAAVILLFLLLNIEIADFYATGPEIAFRFGATVSQDLTYTIGWLAFGMLLLIAGIYLHNRPARITAVALIAVTTLKCFLYDLKSLEGLHRVASFVGLAIALAVVSLIIQKYVLAKPKGAA